jgi:hypothetical protein
MDALLLEEEYAAEERVTLVDRPPASAFPATFRVTVPAGWRPGERSLARIVRDMQRRALGLKSVLLADGAVIRVERTAAYERARRLATPDEDLDDVVDEVSGAWWSNGEEEGFVHRSAPEVVPSPEGASPAASDAPVQPDPRAEVHEAGTARPTPGARDTDPLRRAIRTAVGRFRRQR